MSTKKKSRGGGRRPMTEKKKILSVDIVKKDNNKFMVTIKKEKQREMTPQALRFSSSYYKFLTREDKRLVDSLVRSV